jgi:hypothetical protein
MAAAKEKEKEKEKNLKTIKTSASSRHITKLKQSIFLRCLWLELGYVLLRNDKH